MKWIGVVVAGALLAVAFLTFGMYLSSTPDGKARSAERDTIERCRAAQNDELQDLAVRRLMRQGCDQMEADFRAKWGVSP